MIKNKKIIIALIPARGGSKGVHRKNMREVNGHPLIYYTLQAAINSKYIDDIYLSSDDESTCAYGKKMGINVINRPKEYSSDMASANSVVKHFLSILPKTLREQNPFIVYLQPTSPLRTSKHIDNGFENMFQKNFMKLISVVEATKSPFKSFVVNKQGHLKTLFDEKMTNKRRQDLPSTYYPNGAIYVFQMSEFNKKEAFPSNGSYPYIMLQKDSIDIDIEEDFEILSNRLKSTT